MNLVKFLSLIKVLMIFSLEDICNPIVWARGLDWTTSPVVISPAKPLFFFGPVKLIVVCER